VEPTNIVIRLEPCPDRGFHEQIADWLNKDRESPRAAELRRLLSIWNDSASLADMMAAEKDIDWENISIYLDTVPTGKRIGLQLPFSYLSQKESWYREVDPKQSEGLQVDHARQIFYYFLLGPEPWRLGGPCPKCGKYYVRRTRQQSVYCSHRCASQATAIRRTVELRQQMKEQKLAAAKEGIAKYEELVTRRRARHGWKEFVAAHYPEITSKFLTRAVNQGKLHPPKQEKSS
jgi:hypothetical protein